MVVVTAQIMLTDDHCQESFMPLLCLTLIIYPPIYRLLIRLPHIYHFTFTEVMIGIIIELEHVCEQLEKKECKKIQRMKTSARIHSNPMLCAMVHK